MKKHSFHFKFKQMIKHTRKNAADIEETAEKPFLPLAWKAINDQASVRAKSTIDNYRTALRSFTKYVGGSVAVSQINTHLLEGYQQWLLSRRVSLNTISCYMRSLSALINIVSPDVNTHSLFGKVFTGKTRTDKRSIDSREAGKLRLLSLPRGSAGAFWRDIFMFSLYALGMPFVDIAFLHKKQIINGYIVYARHKTGQRIRIKIEPPMQQIIDQYTSDDSPYVFPILDDNDKVPLIRQYESARTRYNRHLKKLGEQSGVQRVLTSYVARHSWASIAYHANIELSVISKALGHTSPNTTLTYIREIDDTRIDVANNLLVNELLLQGDNKK